jgi:hypothetical protein
LIRLIALYDIVHRYVRYNGHRLTIRVNFMINVCVCVCVCVCVWRKGGRALDPMVSWPRRSHSQWLVTIGCTSLTMWGHGPLEVRLGRAASVMYSSCVIFGAPVLYYRSLKIASTLLRMVNISGRPYGWTITVTHDYKHILYIYIYISHPW